MTVATTDNDAVVAGAKRRKGSRNPLKYRHPGPPGVVRVEPRAERGRSPPSTCVAVVIDNLAHQAIEDLPRLQPATAKVHLSRVAITTEGEFVLVPLPRANPLVALRTLDAQIVRPTKMQGKPKDKPAAIIDSLALRQAPGWTDYNDASCWEAASAVAEAEQMQDEALRRFNEGIARLLCARAGVVLNEVPF